MAGNRDPMDITADPDRPVESHWDLPWVAYTLCALVFATDLRAVARKAVAGEEGELRNPEEVMGTVLGEFVALGENVPLPHEEFSRVIANLEHVLRVHLESDYETQWIALLGGSQDLVDQLSETVRDAVVDFEEFRGWLEREGSTDPEILRTMEGLTGSADRMRLLLLIADQAGEVGAA